MQELRIGVIGTCRRGALADYAHCPEKGVRIVAGADNRPEALVEFGERLQRKFAVPEGAVRFYSDYRDLIADSGVDAVFVTAPDFLHEEMAVAALSAGKAVYLEKPMAITIEDCDRVLRAARDHHAKLYLGHNMRYFQVVLKMKELIDAGAIGEVQAVWCRHFISYGGDAYFRDWHSERRFSNGLLLQKGAHDIDVIHFLCGGYARRVVGMGKLSVYDRCARRRPEEPGIPDFNDEHWPPLAQSGMSPRIDVEDLNSIMMELDNGVQANYMQCHYTPDAERNYTVIGTLGRLENVGDSDDCEVHLWNTRTARATPDAIFKLKRRPGSHGGADPLCVQAFVDFVREGKAPNTSPVAARQAVAVGVKAHESMRGAGGRLEIPPLDPELAAYFDNGQK